MKKQYISLLAAVALASCSMGAAAEENPVVVTVNGEEITQSELDSMVNTLNNRMSQYGIETTEDSIVEIIETSALQELVDDRLLTQDMTAQGCYEMTEDEEDAITTAAQASWDNLSAQYEAYYAQYLEGEEEEGLTASEAAETYLNENGYTIAYLENYYRNALASEKYEEWLMADEPEITDEDVQAAYEERVAESKEAYENDVSAFETAIANGSEVWHRPEGYRAILQIMMSAEGDGDEAKLASVKDKTDDIYARLEKGEAFEDLIREYGKDTAFDTESFYETGYQVHQESILWDEAFIETAFALEEIGDYSQPLVHGDNVHILYYLKDVPGGPVELTDDLASALKEDLYGDRADARMEERLAELTESGEIIYAETERADGETEDETSGEDAA